MTKCAVIILNWNGAPFLKKFLGNVFDRSVSEGYRLYVADNGSTDDSVEWIKKEFPGVDTLLFATNLGYAGGYAEAIKRIEAQYYVLLNSDVEVTDGWLEPMTRFMDNNPDVAACQPRIMSWENREYFEYAGAAGGFIDRYGYPFCRGRIFGKVEKDTGQYNDQKDIFWASGACFMVRADAWREAGGIDPDFFAHMEEIDLCWRLHKLGYRIVYFPGSTVYHVGGGTLSYDSSSKTFYNFRNNLFLLHKNLPGDNFRRIIFTRMLLDGIAGLRFLLMLKINLVLIIFKAHLAYYRAKPGLQRKRMIIKNGRNSDPRHLVLNKSIVFAFFIKGQRTFSQVWPMNKELQK